MQMTPTATLAKRTQSTKQLLQRRKVSSSEAYRVDYRNARPICRKSHITLGSVFFKSDDIVCCVDMEKKLELATLVEA